MLEVGDKTRTQSEVCRIFNEKYPDHHIFQSTVSRAEKKSEFGYKFQLHQELNEDNERRLKFCEVMMDRCQRNPMFPKNILYSGEATFTLLGTMNKQNYRYWSMQNLHWMREGHIKYPIKVNVWAGILNNTIIAPHFFQGIGSWIFPDPVNTRDINRNTWFQQDVATPHYAAAVRDYLNQPLPSLDVSKLNGQPFLAI